MLDPQGGHFRESTVKPRRCRRSAQDLLPLQVSSGPSIMNWMTSGGGPAIEEHVTTTDTAFGDESGKKRITKQIKTNSRTAQHRRYQEQHFGQRFVKSLAPVSSAIGSSSKAASSQVHAPQHLGM
jgi:hypothetical protein